jgi:hypothetical protein
MRKLGAGEHPKPNGRRPACPPQSLAPPAGLDPLQLGRSCDWLGQHSPMRRSPSRGHVGTLGALLRSNRALYMNCEGEGGGHSRQMDLQLLIGAHDEDFPPQQLVERARCSRCGQREVSVTAPPHLGERGKFGYPDHSR